MNCSEDFPVEVHHGRNRFGTDRLSCLRYLAYVENASGNPAAGLARITHECEECLDSSDRDGGYSGSQRVDIARTIGSIEKKAANMVDYHPIMPPTLHLFRLTLRGNDLQTNNYSAYSMGESVADAFRRHIARLIDRKEDVASIQLVEGDLANPRTQTPSNPQPVSSGTGWYLTR